MKPNCNIEYSLKCPCVFLSNFCLFLRTEIIDDVKHRANFLHFLIFHNVRHSLAAEILQVLDIQVVCSKEDFEKRMLININLLHEFSIPALKINLWTFFIRTRRCGSSLDMLLTVFNHLCQYLAGHVRNRDCVVGTIILDHVLDRLRFDRHRLGNLKRFAVGTLESDHLLCCCWRHGDRWKVKAKKCEIANPNFFFLIRKFVSFKPFQWYFSYL